MQMTGSGTSNKASIFHRYKNAILRRLYYRNPINIYLGQKIYGNDSGCLANVIGRLALKKDQLLSVNSPVIPNIYSTAIRQLKENGWVRLNNIDFGEKLTLLRNKLDAYCLNNEIPDSQRLEASTIGGSEQFFIQFPEVKEVLTDELQDFIRQYYGAHFKILNVHLYRIYPVPEDLAQNADYRPYGATGCWHNDGSTVESIKFFVLINDVDETQGPMHVISSDDTTKIIRNKYYRFMSDGLPGSPIEQQADVIKFTGQAGTVLFANPNTCLHRASIPSSGKSRDMLVFYLTSSSKPLEKNWETDAIYQQCLGISRLFNIYRKHQ